MQKSFLRISHGSLLCEKGAGHTGGSNRVKRGGSWNNNASNLRSANRNNNNPDNENNNNGFRVVLPAQAFRRLPEDRPESCPAIAREGTKHEKTRGLVVPVGIEGARVLKKDS